MRSSTTPYGILGLLSLRDWTTYELAQQVRRTLGWFWPRAERRLYDGPKRLTADGFAAATREFTGRRPRTVYRITDAGRAELRRWLGVAPAPRNSEFEGMLKVFFADAGDLAQLRATLDAVEREAVGRLQALAATVGGPDSEVDFPQRRHLELLALRLHAEQEAVVLEWARWAREQIAVWEGTTGPGSWDLPAQARELTELCRRFVDDG